MNILLASNAAEQTKVGNDQYIVLISCELVVYIVSFIAEDFSVSCRLIMEMKC